MQLGGGFWQCHTTHAFDKTHNGDLDMQILNRVIQALADGAVPFSTRVILPQA